MCCAFRTSWHPTQPLLFSADSVPRLGGLFCSDRAQLLPGLVPDPPGRAFSLGEFTDLSDVQWDASPRLLRHCLAFAQTDLRGKELGTLGLARLWVPEAKQCAGPTPATRHLLPPRRMGGCDEPVSGSHAWLHSGCADRSDSRLRISAVPALYQQEQQPPPLLSLGSPSEEKCPSSPCPALPGSLVPNPPPVRSIGPASQKGPPPP